MLAIWAFDSGTPGRVADTTFAFGRGLYDAPIVETITSATPGATIVYTIDGTEPSADHGVRVTALDAESPPVAHVQIGRTTVLRAAAFKGGLAPTNVDTKTYIMVEDVLAQDGTGLPPHAAWGHAGPDWAMDPLVVRAPQYAGGLSRDLRSIPSLALTMAWDDLFGADGRGIYIDGEDVEKPAVAELIVSAGQRGESFDTACTVEIVGGSSVLRWRSDKLSLRLKFPRDLRADVFGDARAAARFDTLVLDAGFNNHWHYGGEADMLGQHMRAQYVLDQYVADLQRAAGGLAPHGRAVFLYLNGLFWGLYVLHERPDADFAAAYRGGRKAEYEVMRHDLKGVVAGSGREYRALVADAGRDLSVRAHYEAVIARLDLDDFIRYVAVNIFVGNTDWSAQNWYASRRRGDKGRPWRFHSWDAERVLDHLQQNVTEVTPGDKGGPLYLHSRLRQSAAYRWRFAAVVRRLVEGPHAVLSPEAASRIYARRLQEIDRAIVLESARWGDNRRVPPYTRDDEWLDRRTYLLKKYFPLRTGIVLQQLRDDGLYPALSERNRRP